MTWRPGVDGDQLELELCCCCCGKVLDTLMTPWGVELVHDWKMWTREPCKACRLELAAERMLGS